MERDSIESRLIQLEEQLNNIINKIELERQESKNDEQSVLDELLGNKGIVEEEIFNLETVLNSINIEKAYIKNYILTRGKKLIKISIVPDSLVDNIKGYISMKSPLAQAILKSKAGDSFKISTPAGDLKYKLKEVNISQ